MCVFVSLCVCKYQIHVHNDEINYKSRVICDFRSRSNLLPRRLSVQSQRASGWHCTSKRTSLKDPPKSPCGGRSPTPFSCLSSSTTDTTSTPKSSGYPSRPWPTDKSLQDLPLGLGPEILTCSPTLHPVGTPPRCWDSIPIRTFPWLDPRRSSAMRTVDPLVHGDPSRGVVGDVCWKDYWRDKKS